jgi:hypothetical protein
MGGNSGIAQGEARLNMLDYTACDRCKYFGAIWTNPPAAYCMKDHPDYLVMLRSRKSIALDQKVYLLGCCRFKWNGMPVNRVAHEEIMGSEEYAKSVLRKLPGEAVTDLVFSEMVEGNNIGANFDREKFEMDRNK